mmetsp:Transcript_11496/g.46477  ORF Transcript_11496/g.46477 Transcript_11496/m.46477 type:complete len:269 (+) Transcript_11496:312-1118(+)
MREAFPCAGGGGLAQVLPLIGRVEEHVDELGQAGGRQRRVLLHQGVGHPVHRGLGVVVGAPVGGQPVDARASVAPDHIQPAAVVQAIEQLGAEPAVAAEPVADRAVAERGVDVGRVSLSQTRDLGKHRVGQLPARGVPDAVRRSWVHQRAQLGGDETVVDEEVLLQRQPWVAALQVTRAVASDTMPQRQVLRAGRRAQRVGLHEAAESLDGLGQGRGREQAAGDGIAAQCRDVAVKVGGHRARCGDPAPGCGSSPGPVCGRTCRHRPA